MNEPAAHRRPKLWLLITMVLVVMAAVGGAATTYWLWQRHTSQNTATSHYFPANITPAQMSIAVYYPVKLPNGYSVSGFTFIKKNVMSYQVTSPSGDKFYVSLQALPVTFDFVAFQKKFVTPDQYQTPIGSDLVGVVGINLIGSIQTNQNVWILLNSAAVNGTKEMEIITRSLRQVSL